jgi:uncharacterized protein (DUF58 family)
MQTAAPSARGTAQYWRQRVHAVADRLRELLRPPRRLRVLRPGGFLIFGTLALGLATLNTGNNLLYLLVGALLGTIALSGWLSEQVLQNVTVVRTPPRAMTAGSTAYLAYSVTNRKHRLPSHGLTIRELTRPGAPLTGGTSSAAVAPREPLVAGPPQSRGAALLQPGFVAVLEPGARVAVRAAVTAQRRGVFQLECVELSTSFPFGLFSKGRDIVLPGVLVVWPRTDRPVRAPRIGGSHGRRERAGAGAAAGAERGDYRGLRDYRPGDDPRDIHWRSTARRGSLVTREYDRDRSDEYWIVLDTVAPDTEAGEHAIEIAAALVARAAARGDRFGLAAGRVRIEPAAGGPRIQAALDALAAVELVAAGPAPAPPASPGMCVLVSARGGAGTGGSSWGDVCSPHEERVS